ncbi:hypothetical protein Cs7R123_27860 [Catellatospora sp. TT07R-123]|uniref:PASTA domain-containing protein n=1 Tax=Catellatospora sp. TT07R-123 TaxID=2733863 RepID=UPI001B2A0843|nr:PASTA domain-containing protein [Catellatospora sp. TT07R-123]GHJ45444.1 hypothetical protein Cs7R123_27860 [Catellatospora sp. TT07R-123]
MSDSDYTTPEEPASTPKPADDGAADSKASDAKAAAPAGAAPSAAQKDDDNNGGRKRWLLLLLLLLLILLLLLCGGFAYMKWWKKSDGPTPGTSPSAVTATTAAASPSPAAPSPSPSAAPSPSPSPAAPVLIAVPNVVGKSATDAEKILATAGFTNVKFVGDDGKELTLLVSWKVTKQSVKAGDKVSGDTEIVLTCTSVSNGKG